MSAQREKEIRVSLGLEEGDDDDEDADDEPRRFLRLPSGHLLCYGGDNGNVSCLLPRVKDSSSKKDTNESKPKFVVVQRYDDAVRCIDVSDDGKRLAIGFDTGKTQVHCFDEYIVQDNNVNSNDDGGNKSLHPYVKALEKFKDPQESDGDGIGKNDDFLLSQDPHCNINDNTFGYFAGPDLGAPARDVLFLPNHSRCDGDPSGSSPSPYLLAVASEAGMFVVDVASKETMDGADRWLEQEAKEAHDRCGIRGLATGTLDKITVLASLAMDGRLCLWDVTGKTLLQREHMPCVPKKDVGEIHDADAFDRSCRPLLDHCARTKGLVIGTPGKLSPCFRTLASNEKDEPMDIKTVPDSSFGDAADAENGHVQSIVVMLLCTDRLLVTSGRDGRVLVWEGIAADANADDSFRSLEWKVVGKHQLASPATDLIVERPASTGKVSLFSACANGSLRVLDISKHYQKQAQSSTTRSKESTNTTVVKANSREGEGDQTKRLSGSTSAPKILKKGRFSDNSEDDESVDFSSSEQPKNVHFLDEAQEDDTESVGRNNKPSTRSAEFSSVEFGSNSDGDDDDSLIDNDLDRLPLVPNRTGFTNLVKPQAAFSPSSTPLDLTRRFLCWNHIGSVTLLQGDNNRNTIDINFADSAFKRPISFTDNINFIIGSIGESGGIFASDLMEEDTEEDDVDGLDELNMSERTKQAVRRDRRKRSKNAEGSKPTGSSIFFYRFETSNLVNRRNKDWHLILPDGERVLGAACGDGWAAAMTSRQFLRFFSPGGNQNQMVWLKGEPVTIVGRGRFLAVFYHESSPLADRTQQLGYTLWDAAEFKILSRGSVSCLSKGSSLSWVGFSNDFSLMVMDTDGMLSMLISTTRESNDDAFMWEWAPILDTVGLRKSTDDCHWPVTVHDGKLVCIPLKGGNTYPDATRRPVTSMLGLRMPLAKSVVSKNSMLEELSVRSNIALSQKNFVREVERDNEDLEDEYVALCAQVDKVTLRLFSGMVDGGKLETAFDLISRLNLEKSYDIAIRIADREHKLADEIEKAKEFKFSTRDDSDCEEDEGITTNDFRGSNKYNRSKQISPDSSRSHKRPVDLHQPVGAGNKRSRFD